MRAHVLVIRVVAHALLKKDVAVGSIVDFIQYDILSNFHRNKPVLVIVDIGLGIS